MLDSHFIYPLILKTIYPGNVHEPIALAGVAFRHYSSHLSLVRPDLEQLAFDAWGLSQVVIMLFSIQPNLKPFINSTKQ